jgi:glycosyltransferase involved in cell wall biosynthesis
VRETAGSRTASVPDVESRPHSVRNHVDIVHITTVPMSLTFLRGQVGFMKARGLRMHAITSPGPELEAFGVREGVGTTAVEMHRRVTPIRDLRATARLVRALRQLRPTIVHAHTPKGGLLGMIAALSARVPVRIYHMRGLPYTGATGFRRLILRMTERVSCALAHRVLCVSHALRAQAVGEGLCEAEKILVIAGGSGNGVDSGIRFNPDLLPPDARHATRQRFAIPDEATVIGFIGRIVRQKGIVELAEAWSTVKVRHPTARLLLVGPFEPEDALPAHVEAGLRNDPRVHLAGLDWNTAAMLAAMDVVVLPTYREGFPNVPLEAAAMGLPVVATTIPSCAEAVLDEQTGLLVPPRDASALAHALARYLDDPVFRRKHGAAGQKRVRAEFQQERIWRGILEQYEGLAATRAPGVPLSTA